MEIIDSKGAMILPSAGPAAKSTVQSEDKSEAPRGLPVQADKYQGSVEEHHWVKGADLSTYKKVCGAIGAASLAFASNIALPVGAGAAGAAIGGIAGALVAGPIGAVVGKIAGGLAGAFLGGKLQLKTKIGRKIGGVLGDMAGKAFALAAKALKIPLRSDHIKETENYSTETMKTRLSHMDKTSHPTISKEEAKKFIDQLKPGDMVLTNDEACTIFSLIIVAVDGKADFNHALLYAGDNVTIESRTVTNGVARGNLEEVLSHKHHAIAIRPDYDESKNQAQKTVDAGVEMIGTPYDFRFRMGDDSMYCSEVVYKAVKQGAPEINFKKRPLITREVVLPGDLLRTSQAQVVAEVGKDSTLFNSYLAKFV